MHAYHLQRGWENGLGYHFVIGNGVGYTDGKVFVGPRWKKQQPGAHCKAGAGTYFGVRRAGNFFNDNGIGICLIGNFENGRPTAKQQATLKKLILHLCRETGISPKRVYGHGEVTHGTLCPGRNFSIASLRSTLAAAEAGVPPFAAEARQRAAEEELTLARAGYLTDADEAAPRTPMRIALPAGVPAREMRLRPERFRPRRLITSPTRRPRGRSCCLPRRSRLRWNRRRRRYCRLVRSRRPREDALRAGR